MNTQLESVIKNKVYAPIYSSIDACIRDLKRAEYTYMAYKALKITGDRIASTSKR